MLRTLRSQQPQLHLGTHRRCRRSQNCLQNLSSTESLSLFTPGNLLVSGGSFYT
ncbi:hypothetical protein [Maridesulfovibrio salexigens]|uniref:hypothetical protein n=1 Tax=Maridesulfovibrio salexigens TaxID=880 RepID=UPI003CCAB165